MSDLPSRPAGYGVAYECLAIQSEKAPRSALARFFGVDPMSSEAVSWYQGALGEIVVGRALERLGPEWTVLHSVPVGLKGSDIDHIVVGPSGVYTINTKRHRGKRVWVGDRIILVNGQKTDHLRNSRYEAERASKLLSQAVGTYVPVTPLLVIVESAGVTTRSKPKDVQVLVLSELVRWLKRRKPNFDPDVAAIVARAAANPRTWTSVPARPLDEAVMTDFATLRAEDEGARHRRIAWIVVGAAIGTVVVTSRLLELIN